MSIVSYKKYICLCALCSICTLIVVGLIAVKALFFDSIFGYQKLYQHQINKIKNNRGVETIFVGDSSLGNAVDAVLFSDLSSMKTMNLALTGVYGYAGSYNMIKKAHKKNKIQNVVIVQALDMMRRETAFDGYIYSFESPHDLTFSEWVTVSETCFNIMFSPVNLMNIFANYCGLISDSNEIVNDYIKQKTPLDIQSKGRNINFDDSFNKDKIRFLIKIRDYCKANSINLVYVHGPIWEPIGLNSALYIERVSKIIESMGIKIYKRPFLIPDSMLGDSFDHASIGAKAFFTKSYFDAIGAMLVHELDTPVIEH